MGWDDDPREPIQPGDEHYERCRRILTVGVSPTPFVRCNQPEDHPLHDPSSGAHPSHPYDPAPVVPEDIPVGPETNP